MANRRPGHEITSIEELGGTQFALVCECGWQSPRSDSAGIVGSAWDDHLRSVTADSHHG